MTTSYLGARPVARPAETSMNLAMLGYALLFASIFFAGLPALIAVVIAYSQRGEAPTRALRNHFKGQIRIFWVALTLTLAAASCALAGLVAGLGEIISVATVSGFDRVGGLRIELSEVTLDARILGLLGAAVAFGFLSSIWLLAASSLGFIRLASEPAGA
jgi:uncharacterized membrane protein